MKTPESAAELAGLCVDLAAAAGRHAVAAVTDMSEPLGCAVGNALDIAEAVDVLAGRERGHLRDLSVLFAARALTELDGVLPSAAGTPSERAERALDDGSALERFGLMVEAQDGDRHVVDDPWSVLPKSPVARPIEAPQTGFVSAIQAEDVGRAAVRIGAGRVRKGGPVDPAVGIVLMPKIGDHIEERQRIGTIHTRTEADAEQAIREVLAALTVSEEPVDPPPLVYGWRTGTPAA
jgi:pyrimidine-nucleoside phosphorylase